ncbi:hypothetical protein [Rubinisphaera italica]|uniref:Uncharacterized protein n=1 Tax=Rubinisphaera italica TaxID=2527969 RepID=A0A5C5XNV3_9PLAN|nr:hypothetical protein [Rubinisphaera italica]TWT64229.1 hypothetical protein Pan54_49900 [Rubinisphaera italica]
MSDEAKSWISSWSVQIFFVLMAVVVFYFMTAGFIWGFFNEYGSVSLRDSVFAPAAQITKRSMWYAEYTDWQKLWWLKNIPR